MISLDCFFLLSGKILNKSCSTLFAMSFLESSYKRTLSSLITFWQTSVSVTKITCWTTPCSAWERRIRSNKAERQFHLHKPRLQKAGRHIKSRTPIFRGHLHLAAVTNDFQDRKFYLLGETDSKFPKVIQRQLRNHRFDDFWWSPIKICLVNKIAGWICMTIGGVHSIQSHCRRIFGIWNSNINTELLTRGAVPPGM